MIENVLFYALLAAAGLVIVLIGAILNLKAVLLQERADAAMLVNELSKQKRMVELQKEFDWDKGEEPEMDLTA